MGEDRENINFIGWLAGMLGIACFCLLLVGGAAIVSVKAWAQATSFGTPLQLPLPEISGSHFGYSKERGRLHAGVDLRARTPTPVSYIGNFQNCTTGSDGLVIGTVANACGVTQRFLHLTSCGGGKFVTGNSGINKRTGKPYDYHLHWEVQINNTPVDPEKAVGKDLCNEQIRKELLDDAKLKGSGSGATDANVKNNSAAPPVNQENMQKEVAYVAPGATNPFTGQVNTGNAYFYEKGPDGRVVLTPAPNPDGTNDAPILPPVTTDVVPTTTTNNPVTGCATDTWTAMTNQAVLQTRRETMYNQAYINKADSVLAYACFEEHLKDMGKRMTAFSTTKKWVNKQIDILGKTVTTNLELGEGSLDNAVRNAAIAAGQNFINSHALHGFLGGRMEAGGGGEAGEAGQQLNTPCTKMAEVWQTAKCMNVEDEPYKKFTDLIEPESDPRVYPESMRCNNTGITQEMIDITQNKSAKFDKITSYLDKLMPNGNICAEPVMTGVTVVRQEGAGIITRKINYPDGVCLSPGCSYQNSGSGKGKCEVAAP